jgi:pimeloyl-ACP methyl ester carboxylesterase
MTLAGALGAGGCASVRPADASRGALSGADRSAAREPIAWPERDPAAFEHPVWKAAIEHSGRELVVTFARERAGRLEVSPRRFPITRTSVARAGVGVLSEFELRISEPAPEPARRFAFVSSITPVVSEYVFAPGALGGAGSGEVVVPIPLEWPFDPPAPGGRTPPEQARRPDVPVVEPRSVRLYSASATVIRVWPMPEGVAVRGYAVALRPIAGRAYTLGTLKRLRDDGWVIVEGGLGLGERFALQLRDAKADADLDGLGRALAAEVDEQLAELAYAVEAVLERLEAERSAGRGKGVSDGLDGGVPPVLVVGFSGGALAAPAVAARLGESGSGDGSGRVAGAVLVGGGAGIGRILQTSTLTQSGLAVRRGGKRIAGDDLERLNRAYLHATALDPVKTAPRLAGVPVLMLHAERDDIVPAAAGDELHRLLDRPERWVFDTGHELLFWRLSAYAGDIARWVSHNVPAAKP